MAPATPNNLRPVQRFITDHNNEGKAIFSSALAEEMPTETIYNGAVFGLAYATNERPVSLADGKDIETYKPLLAKPPGIVITGGTVARFVDTPPDSISPMHRTVSLDYGVVIEGEIELVLDSGEVRLMKPGDIAIQRGTMHAWRNPSKTVWARMLYFLQESDPITINGTTLGEDYGDMAGHVADSK